MRRRHFETLRPVCPVCRPAGAAGSTLGIAEVVREEADHIIEGALNCSNKDCLREYPIVDGIPLIVGNIRQYVSDQFLAIYGRGNLSPFIESMLGDCCGPASQFDQTRQHLSSYTWDHYGDLDPQMNDVAPRPGSMIAALELGNQLAGAKPPGPLIDAGCSVGRSTFELANQRDELVLGVDLNFAMLRLASEVLRHGIVRYPLRRVGLVYDVREFPAEFSKRGLVDFWACDVAALPFPPATFSLATSMNVLDCVHSPRELLVSLANVLKEGGKAILTCPYDWSAAATPLEAWLGGHSQRSPLAGSSSELVRQLLTPGAHPSAINSLKLLAEREHLPWRVRLHDRSVMTYLAHLVVATRTSDRQQ